MYMTVTLQAFCPDLFVRYTASEYEGESQTKVQELWKRHNMKMVIENINLPLEKVIKIHIASGSPSCEVFCVKSLLVATCILHVYWCWRIRFGFFHDIFSGLFHTCLLLLSLGVRLVSHERQNGR